MAIRRVFKSGCWQQSKVELENIMYLLLCMANGQAEALTEEKILFFLSPPFC